MQRAAKAYRGVAVESATPARLMDEIFLRIQRDCANARRAIQEGDPSGCGKSLNNAIELLDILTISLNKEAAPELAGPLLGLYSFARSRMMDAHSRANPESLDEATGVLSTIHEAFAEATNAA